MLDKRKRGKIYLTTACVILCLSCFLIGCTGQDEKNTKIIRTEIPYPAEEFVITNLVYEEDTGVQVAGFERTSPTEVMLSAWIYTEEKEWVRRFERRFFCNNKQRIEADMYWDSGQGFLLPYTWNEGDAMDDSLVYEVYYVSSNGETMALDESVFSSMSNAIFLPGRVAYWIDNPEFSLMRWNAVKNGAPKKIELTSVKQVDKMAYANGKLYILGFEGDATIYDITTEKELPASPSLTQCSEDVDLAGLAANEFIFGVFQGEETELLFYIDESGIYKYENGEKIQLLDGSSAGFGAEPRFDNIAVKNQNTIILDYFNIEGAEAELKLCIYTFKE